MSKGSFIVLAYCHEGRLKTYFSLLAQIFACQYCENQSKLHCNTTTTRAKLIDSLTSNILKFDDHSDDEDKLIKQTNFKVTKKDNKLTTKDKSAI